MDLEDSNLKVIKLPLLINRKLEVKHFSSCIVVLVLILLTVCMSLYWKVFFSYDIKVLYDLAAEYNNNNDYNYFLFIWCKFNCTIFK